MFKYGLNVKRLKNGDLNTCCPFHGERTPSFFIVERKNFYHCFGCGTSGYANALNQRLKDFNIEKRRRFTNKIKGIPQLSEHEENMFKIEQEIMTEKFNEAWLIDNQDETYKELNLFIESKYEEKRQQNISNGLEECPF